MFAPTVGQSSPLGRNVTAVGGDGVLAQTPNQNDRSVFFALRNVIALGSTSADVKANNFGGASGFVEVVLENSSYDSVAAGSGTVVTPAGTGTNQTAAPAFVDAAGGAYRHASSRGARSINTRSPCCDSSHSATHPLRMESAYLPPARY